MSTTHIKLSPTDQIMVRSYVRIVLCFRTNSKSQEAMESIRTGIERTTQQLSFLRGTVQRVEDSVNNEVEMVYHSNDKAKFFVTDNTSQLPSYEALSHDVMPIAALKDELICPVGNVVDGTKPLPALLVQANIVEGGLLLCLCLHHSVTDGTGLGTLIQIIAANSAGSPSSVLISEEDLDRTQLAYGCQEPVLLKDCPSYKLADPSLSIQKDLSAADIPAITSRLFYITKESLAALKTDASPTDGWISTMDALCALLWSCITRARAARLSHTDLIESRLCLPINCRSRIVPPLRNTYLGNVSIDALVKSAMDTLISAPLREISPLVRSANKAITPDYLRKVIKMIQGCSSDLSYLKTDFCAVLGHDIMVTSWADLPVYDLDFGSVLGKPEWVRCPYRTLDGTVKVLPRRKTDDFENDGSGLKVNVELRKDDMMRLLGDEMFLRYISHTGL